MQFIFLVEADKHSKSDYIYIKSLINEKYSFLQGEHKLSPIYMGGKGNYSRFEKNISSLISKYKNTGLSKVFICVDIDSPSNSAFLLNEKIQKYAKKIGAEFVWFNEDVEQVFWGNSAFDTEKTMLANKYESKQLIKKLDVTLLEHKEVKSKKTSNLCTVLDNYLKRKN